MRTFFLHKTVKTVYVVAIPAETEREAVERMDKAWREHERGESTPDSLQITNQGTEESCWRVHDHT